MPPLRFRSTTAFLCLAGIALAMGGCSQVERVMESSKEGGLFSKPIDVFAKPAWSDASDTKAVSLGPRGPVGPEELVNADGSCAPSAAQAETQAAPADRPVGSAAGDLAGAPM
ncbi:MAG: hypothetical protein ACK4UO_11890, partial [Pseudolabrys sp.]